MTNIFTPSAYVENVYWIGNPEDIERCDRELKARAPELRIPRNPTIGVE